MTSIEQSVSAAIGNERDRCQFLLRLSREQSYDSPRRSLSFAREALRLSERLQDMDLRARCLHSISWSYWNSNRHEQAFEAATAALNIAIDLGNEETIALSHLYLGFCSVEAGDLFGAQECFDTVRESASNIGDKVLEAVALVNLCNVCDYLKQQELGLQFIGLAEQIYGEHADDFDGIGIYLNAASSHIQLGRQALVSGNDQISLAHAELALMRAVMAYDESRVMNRVSHIIGSLEYSIVAFSMVGQFDQAEAYLVELKPLVQGIKQFWATGAFHCAKGAIDEFSGHFRKAAKHYALAARCYERFGSRHRAQRAHELAYSCFDRASSMADAYFHLKSVYAVSEQRQVEACQRRSQMVTARQAMEKAKFERDILEARNEMLSERAEDLKRQTITDGLTGAMNRRGFEESIAIAPEFGPMCISMLDLDHFKQINDQFGHMIGDEVLRETVRLMQSCVRNGDLVGRVGGEEFAILLQGARIEEAMTVCERLRREVENANWSRFHPDLTVTISIGVHEWPAEQDPIDALSQADEALYLAKRSGRNQVRTSSEIVVLARAA